MLINGKTKDTMCMLEHRSCFSRQIALSLRSDDVIITSSRSNSRNLAKFTRGFLAHNRENMGSNRCLPVKKLLEVIKIHDWTHN